MAPNIPLFYPPPTTRLPLYCQPLSLWPHTVFALFHPIPPKTYSYLIHQPNILRFAIHPYPYPFPPTLKLSLVQPFYILLLLYNCTGTCIYTQLPPLHSILHVSKQLHNHTYIYIHLLIPPSSKLVLVSIYPSI